MGGLLFMEKERLDALPVTMKAARQWIATQGKKPAGGKAYQLPENWKAFDDVAACENPGFYLANGFICLDLDKVLNGGKILKSATALLTRVHELAGKTYTERSCSGRGLHLIYRLDQIPADFPAVPKIPLGRDGVLEVYTRRHYIAMTGDVMGHRRDVTTAPPALLDFLKEEAGKGKAAATDGGARQDVNVKKKKKDAPGGRLASCKVLSPDEIPPAISSSFSGDLFDALFYKGDTSHYGGDQSRADSALFTLLAPYCGAYGGDLETMIEVFKASALYQTIGRKEGHEDDYLKRTAKAALDNWDGWYYGKPSQEGEAALEDPEHVDVLFPAWDLSGKKPRLLAAHWRNTAALLDALGITCRYNLMSKDIEIRGQAGGEVLDTMSADAAAVTLRGFALSNGLKVNQRDMESALVKIADSGKYNPVCNYLTAALDTYTAALAGGDTADYIGQMFSRFVFSADYEHDSTLDALLFRKWLIGAARIAFNTGNDTMQGVLVLQGAGGIGKSRFLYSLVPPQGRPWVHGETSINPYDKDSRLQATKYWLVEVSEMGDTMRRERQERLKQFWTSPTDEIRVPYGRRSEDRPRVTAYYGTANDSGILKDPTGNRRYWVFSLQEVKPLPDGFNHALFWGQVMHAAFIKKEKSYLDRASIDKLNKQNEHFEALTNEEQAILDRLQWDAPPNEWTWRTSTDVGDEIGVKGRSRVVGKALKHLSRRDTRVKEASNHHNGRRYLLPPLKFDADEDSMFSPK